MIKGFPAPVSVYPIFAVMGAAVALAGGFVLRIAGHPDVVWNRRGNPTPWNTVQQDQTTKFMDPLNQFKSSWRRNGI
ncbi:NADH-ubiquinone reductase complex 1 MLRQ subunit-domain-containing protein [Cladochytrium replicatum]|nr:NADH-ubiquinone reductase complex 1 MLRQ subunit-domain-containing protein [Cladochytrium replicatum]